MHAYCIHTYIYAYIHTYILIKLYFILFVYLFIYFLDFLPDIDCNTYYSDIDGAVIKGRGFPGYYGHCNITLATGSSDPWMIAAPDMCLNNCEVTIEVFGVESGLPTPDPLVCIWLGKISVRTPLFFCTLTLNMIPFLTLSLTLTLALALKPNIDPKHNPEIKSN